MFIPNVFAKGVEIKSIELVSKSDNTVEKLNPTFNGLEMNFDLSFKVKNDNAKYKVVIKNDTNTDYQISEDTSFNTSKYITYKYEVDSLLKARSETTVYVSITYSKAIDDSLLVDGKYSETNKAIVQLLNEDGQIVNPKTSKINMIILIVIFVSTVVTVSILKKKDKLKYSSMALIIGIVSIPTFVSAIDTIKLTMDVKVEIEKGYKVGYLLDDYALLIKESEMTSYEMTASNCIIYYVNSVSDDNKYRACNNIIKMDGRLYSEGETVTLKSIPIRTYISLNQVEISTDVYLITDGNIRPNDIVVHGWGYSRYSSNDYSYPFFSSDKAIMNFNNYEVDNWEDNESFDVNAPQSFTMPGHDVLFVSKCHDDFGGCLIE